MDSYNEYYGAMKDGLKLMASKATYTLKNPYQISYSASLNLFKRHPDQL